MLLQHEELNKFENFSKFEFENEDWTGRTWETNIDQINIKRLNGWFQMYFYPINGEVEQT